MRVLLITQNDVFYLPECLGYLLDHLPSHSQVVGSVVFNVSPFGKQESFRQKAIRTYQVFGADFFAWYGWRYLYAKATGRTVAAALRRRGIPTLSPPGSINSEESLALIAAYEPDLIISIAGNQIFKRKLIDMPPKGLLNLHTALLPKYRGLMPTFWVLKNQEAETGVSLFFVDEGIDTGPILVQKRFPINGMTQAQLIKATKKLGMDAVIEGIDKIEKDNFSLIENSDADMTYFSFPTKDDVREFRSKGCKFY